MIKEMSVQWHNEVYRLGKRLNPEDYESFVNLIYSSKISLTLNTIRTLLKTYHDEPDDFGTQECIEGTLTIAKQEYVVTATLEELPRLLKESPEWTLCLITRILEYDFNLLRQVINKFPSETKKILLDALYSDNDLDTDYINSKKIKDYIISEI